MRETKFIEQNKKKWREFERNLQSNRKDPDKLSELFIEITDDLSFSRTFYPNRSVRVYLNNLAQQIFYNIYKNKKTRRSRFIKFWTTDVPQLFFEARKDLLLAFVIFFLALSIGILSTLMDPEFPRVILGDAYVEMTIENIRNGDPMAVYKDDNELISALWITQNNLRVAFFTFVGGIFFMIGTVGVMIYNGIMVGAFQTFFALQDSAVFQESLLTIWMHGALEISAIIIAGAAGLTMGRGLVFPGTYSRLQAFQVSARRGVKMMIGIAPIIIIAGFIEGFITRYTEIDDFVRAIFILLCFAFVLFYYVWFPSRQAKRGKVSEINETKLPPNQEERIDYTQIKSNGEIFTDTFIFYRKNFTKILPVALAAAGLYTITHLLVYGDTLSGVFTFHKWSIFIPSSLTTHFENLHQIFTKSGTLGLALNTFLLTLITFWSFRLIKKDAPKLHYDKSPLQKRTAAIFNFLKIGGLFLFVFVLLQIKINWIIGAIPLVLLWLNAMILEEKNPFTAFVRGASLFSSAVLQTAGLVLMVVIVMIIFSFIFNADLTWYLLDVIGWNFADRGIGTQTYLYTSLIFLFSLGIALLLPLLIFALGILHFTLMEIVDATSLKERIKWIGVKRSVYGLEKES